jgi:tryptophan-rich sensory protein
MAVTPSVAHPSAAAPVPPSGGRGLLGLAGWLLVTFAAGAGGGIAAGQAASLYLVLDRPPWAPPAWLFGPAWSVLYTAMAVAAWMVWRARGWRGARGALTLFLLQLVPNALWTWTFFVQRRASWATADIVVLLVLIVATMVAFARVRRLAGALLVPYLAWVSFATALTVALWRRNPGILG